MRDADLVVVSCLVTGATRKGATLQGSRHDRAASFVSAKRQIRRFHGTTTSTVTKHTMSSTSTLGGISSEPWSAKKAGRAKKRQTHTAFISLEVGSRRA